MEINKDNSKNIDIEFNLKEFSEVLSNALRKSDKELTSGKVVSLAAYRRIRRDRKNRKNT